MKTDFDDNEVEENNDKKIVIRNNTNLGENTLIGNKSNNNTAIGYSTNSYNINGYQNTGIGSFSLYNNIEGINNTSVGFKSLNQVLAKNPTKYQISNSHKQREALKTEL